MPKRIQRQRTKGWRMPAGAVYVGRPTKWGNPYRVGSIDFERLGDTDHTITPERAVLLYRKNCNWQVSSPKHPEPVSWAEELRGKDLVCWCPLEDADGNPVPCHADVLLEWANREVGGG